MKKFGPLLLIASLGFLAVSMKKSSADEVKPSHLSEEFKCEKCHTVQGWKISSFNHEKTGFPLEGIHKNIDCRACHISGKFKEPIADQCNECHNDVHGGRLGKFCETCHDENSWKNSFTVEQHRRTNFPLTGSHALIPCQECHVDSRDSVFTRVAIQCESCHQADYLSTATGGTIDHVAAGLSNKCQTCHRSTTWKPAIGFQQHDKCFPINGGPHGGIACLGCHTSISNIGSMGSCNSGTFFCGGCHQGTHSQTKMNQEHSEVPGYQYTDQKCYECHPRGRS